MKRALITLLLALALPASASAGCMRQDSAQWFSKWGDDADYFPAPGGLFDGALDWASTGDVVLAQDSNPFAVDADDRTSLSLGGASSVTSPPICLSRWHPFLRYAARALGDTKPRLGLSVIYADDKGKPKRVPISDLDPKQYGRWTLTRRVDLKKVLPRDDNPRTVQLRFLVGPAAPKPGADAANGWYVDNVFVDPVKKG